MSESRSKQGHDPVEFSEGEVIICGTGQAGTVIQVNGRELMVLLTNGNIWMGGDGQCYHPDADVLAAAPLEVDRFEGRDKPKPIHRER